MHESHAMTMTPPTVQAAITTTPSWLALEPEPASARLARAHARKLLDGADHDFIDDVVLVVGELVANAVVHAPVGYIASAGVCPLIHMSVQVERRWVLVGVHDPWPGVPRTVHADLDGESGRGLTMVDRIATAHWYQTREADKTVHALILRPGATLHVGELERLRRS